NVNIMQFTPALGQFACDDYYFQTDYWKTESAVVRNSYIWADDIYESAGSLDWNILYEQIYYANCVLEGIERQSDAINPLDYQQLKGSALFIRAYAFFNLAETFASPYKELTAEAELGIPLRLNPDLSEKSKRSTLQQTYNQILDDLNKAVD